MPEVLIDCKAAADLLLRGGGGIALDCRNVLGDADAGYRAFVKERIAGARHCPLKSVLSGMSDGTNGRHPLPEPQTFAGEMAARGVFADTPVVVYDEITGPFAARGWWLLQWLGFHNARVLDGGFRAWQNAGLPTENGDSPPPQTQQQTQAQVDNAQTATADDVLQNKSAALLLDARSPERWRGDNEPLDPVAGRIPGSVNRLHDNNLQGDGTMKPAQQLREEFDKLTGGDNENIVHYCGSGVTACHNILAMRAAGLHGGRLFPGSWSEWCADTSRPVEKGE